MTIDRIIRLTVIALPLAVGCTGSLPSSSALPKLDGSQLTNVNATTINGVSSSTLTDAVGSATNQSTGSTLVMRDASGNFSAGTVRATLLGNATSSTFSTGSQGADLTAASTLALGSDGNYFNVTGSTSIDQLSAMPAGARVTLSFNSALTLNQSSAHLQLQGGGPFNVVAGDVFEFVSFGGGWREILRSVTNESRVVVYGLAAGSLLGAEQILPFGTSAFAGSLPAIVDTQGEFTPSSGVFTPRQSGYYRYTASFITQSVDWGTAGTGGCRIRALINNAPLRAELRNQVTQNGNTSQCSVSVSGGTYLNAGVQFRFGGATPNINSARIADDAVNEGYFNAFSIERTAN